MSMFCLSLCHQFSRLLLTLLHSFVRFPSLPRPQIGYADVVLFESLTSTPNSEWYLSNCAIRELSSLLLSFSKLSFVPSEDFLYSISEMSDSILVQDDPEAIALLAYSLSKCKAGDAHSSATAIFFEQVASRADDLLGDIENTSYHYRDYNCYNAGMLAIAIASSGVNAPNFSEALFSRHKSIVDSGSVEDVSNIASYYGEVGHLDLARDFFNCLERRQKLQELGLGSVEDGDDDRRQSFDDDDEEEEDCEDYEDENYREDDHNHKIDSDSDSISSDIDSHSNDDSNSDINNDSDRDNNSGNDSTGGVEYKYRDDGKKWDEWLSEEAVVNSYDSYSDDVFSDLTSGKHKYKIQALRNILYALVKLDLHKEFGSLTKSLYRRICQEGEEQELASEGLGLKNAEHLKKSLAPILNEKEC